MKLPYFIWRCSLELRLKYQRFRARNEKPIARPSARGHLAQLADGDFLYMPPLPSKPR